MVPDPGSRQHHTCQGLDASALASREVSHGLLQGLRHDLQEQQARLQQEQAVNERLRTVRAELTSTSAELVEENARLSQTAQRLEHEKDGLSAEVTYPGQCPCCPVSTMAGSHRP